MSKVTSFLVKEVKEMLPSLIFFLIVFHMMAITKALILVDYNISAGSASIATVAALIVAKAILIVDKLPLARLFSNRLLVNVIWKTLLYGVIAILFRFLEQAVHAGSIVVALNEWIEIHSSPRSWVIQMWLFSSLFLYCLVSEFVKIIGPDKVRAILFDKREPVS